jgi:inosine-uridine nucleoside N-ribohydrolase
LQAHPEIELVGITTVAGNASLEVVTRNALFLAERFAIPAPIAAGAARPLRRELREVPAFIHGVNGLGDVPIDAPPRDGHPRPPHRFIIESVRARPGEITLLAVGMLTNLARAITEDPGIVPLVRDVIIMGGAFGTAGRYGNAQPAAEANIYGDPHAADLVCTARWPLTIIGLDVTEGIVMSNAYLRRLRDHGGAAGAFIWEITRGYEAFHERGRRVNGIFAHDPAAAVCVLDPACFGFRLGAVRVATEGIVAGLTAQKVEGRGFPPSPWDDLPSARVAIDVDAERVLRAFAEQFWP